MNKCCSWYCLINYLNSCGVVHSLQGDVVGGDHSVVDPATERLVWSFRRSESLISLSSLSQLHHCTQLGECETGCQSTVYLTDIILYLPTASGVIKRCRLSWLTNRALVYEPKAGGGGGGLRGLSQWVQLCTWSPNKLWRSNSIFNLWLQMTSKRNLYRGKDEVG